MSVGPQRQQGQCGQHASPEEYRASTGFACLLGCFTLSGQMARVEELPDAPVAAV